MTLYLNMFAKCQWHIRNAGVRLTTEAMKNNIEKDDKTILFALDHRCRELKTNAIYKGLGIIFFAPLMIGLGNPGLDLTEHYNTIYPLIFSSVIVTTSYYRMLYSTVFAQAASEYARVYPNKESSSPQEIVDKDEKDRII